MFTLNCKGRLLTIDKPVVMGIINVTPDSFYSGSRQQQTDAVLRKAEQMLEAGALILDLGGQSTRPGSNPVSAEEELKRVIDPLQAVHQRFPEAWLSIDTYYAGVAGTAVKAGASIVNDISAGRLDELMLSTVASLQVPYVLMHMRGTPQNMQEKAVYRDVTLDVLDELIREKERVQLAGITDIIIDPGFGFSKTTAHNFSLLKRLSVFRMLNAPLLLGISRKSFIWKTIGVTADEALTGTIALQTAGLLGGATILRVHDVKEAVQTITLVETMLSA